MRQESSRAMSFAARLDDSGAQAFFGSDSIANETPGHRPGRGKATRWPLQMESAGRCSMT